MRNALQKPSASGSTTPAPVKGLNTVKNFSELDPEEAAVLDNFYPQIGRVKLRRGSAYHAYSEIELATEDGELLTTEDGITLTTEGENADPLLALMPYSAGTTQALFAASGNAIYDVTTAGAISTAVQSSLNSGQWSYTMFATSGGNFLFMVNGADDPRYYDGSTWTLPSITGITSSELETVTAHKRRLWFTRINSLKAYYLGSEAIAGALTSFDLAPVFPRGGRLVAIGTWTLDAGDGLDDYAVFLTSEGEVAIYQGTDPSSANTWALTGVFRIGRPLGKRCMQKLGPELVVLTEDGFGELSRMIGRARTEDARLSRKIMPSVVADARDRVDSFGWQWCFYPRENMLLVNVPGYANGKQYVMNTEILSWCTFSNWPANAFEVFGGDLYFCGGTSVYKADAGTHDYGNAIMGDVKTGSSYFRSRGRQKRFTMIRPILETTGTPVPQIAVLPDFSDAALQEPSLTLGGGGAEWDVAEWDVASWGSTERVQAEWYVVEGIGYCAALRMKLTTKTATIAWIATDWLYETGGYV